MDAMFPHYVGHLRSAVSNFAKSHWPCEYVKPEGGLRCINVSTGHSKGHQAADGRIIAAGEFETHISSEDLQHEFDNTVYYRLRELLTKLQILTGHDGNRLGVAKRIHQEDTMNSFWSSLKGNDDRHFHSHSACFCCLFEVPEHPLPCGHVICTSCANIFSDIDGSPTLLKILECPLCTGGPKQTHPYTISLKPKTAGSRILTLDG